MPSRDRAGRLIAMTPCAAPRAASERVIQPEQVGPLSAEAGSRRRAPSSVKWSGLSALARRAQRLVDVWSHLTIDRVLSIDRGELFTLMRTPRRPAAAGFAPDAPRTASGLVDPRGHRAARSPTPSPSSASSSTSTPGILNARHRLHHAHRLAGAPSSSSAQKERARPQLEPRSDHDRRAGARMQPVHALASAAIPHPLPRGRASTASSTATAGSARTCRSRRRAASAPTASSSSTRATCRRRRSATTSASNEDLFPGPLFLLGKTLNALLLDRIDTDLARLAAASTRSSTPAPPLRPATSSTRSTHAMGTPPGQGLAPDARRVLVRASRGHRQLAAEFVRAPAFAQRNAGVLGRLMRRLAEAEGATRPTCSRTCSSTANSPRELIELGRADARRAARGALRLLRPSLAALTLNRRSGAPRGRPWGVEHGGWGLDRRGR